MIGHRSFQQDGDKTQIEHRNNQEALARNCEAQLCVQVNGRQQASSHLISSHEKANAQLSPLSPLLFFIKAVEVAPAAFVNPEKLLLVS